MTTILIVDDHRMFRDGLRALLETDSKYQVIGEADNGYRAIELTEKLKPDIVIMDIAMSDLNGIEATRRICKEEQHSRILALSVHSDSRFVAQMLEAGASGYIIKDCAFEELEQALAVILEGRTYLSPEIAHVVVKDFLDYRSGKAVLEKTKLTEREREVLQLFAEGNSTKGIASSLHVSTKTIETHRKRIMDKLDIHNIAELTKYAVRQGLTSLHT